MSLVGDIFQGMDRQAEKHKTTHVRLANPPAASPVSAPAIAADVVAAAATTKKARGLSLSKGAKHKQRGVDRGYTVYANEEQTESKQLRAELSKQKQQNWNQGQQIHAIQQRREAEQADMRRRERESDSKWDRGVRCEQWATRLVGLHGEDGEILPPNARVCALQDLMDHTYGRGSLDSRRVVTAVEAQRWSSISPNPLARGLSTLPVDTSVWYLRDDELPVPATIVATDGIGYTIEFDSGAKRNTMRSKLVPW